MDLELDRFKRINLAEYAASAAMAGVPIIQVQQWMGHSTIAMTMRYAHLSLPGRARTGSGCSKRLRIHGTLTALHGSRIRKHLLLRLVK
jgi:hypothetical protein